MQAEALAHLHARCFADTPRSWTAAEFTELLAASNVQMIPEGEHAFAVIRHAGPEAEILTICTDPGHRRQGLARSLLVKAEVWARSKGAGDLFLEVAACNTAARALYAAAGFREIGIRKDYYSSRGNRRVAAIVLAKTLVVLPSRPDTENSH